MKTQIIITCFALLFSLKMNAENNTISTTNTAANNTVQNSIEVPFAVSPILKNTSNKPFVRIYSKVLQPLDLQIFNMNGDCEKRQTVYLETEVTDVEIDLVKLPPGLYLVHFHINGGNEIRMFKKQ